MAKTGGWWQKPFPELTLVLKQGSSSQAEEPCSNTRGRSGAYTSELDPLILTSPSHSNSTAAQNHAQPGTLILLDNRNFIEVTLTLSSNPKSTY